MIEFDLESFLLGFALGIYSINFLYVAYWVYLKLKRWRDHRKYLKAYKKD